MKDTQLTSNERLSRQRNAVGLAIAAGALLGVALVALSVPVSQASRDDVRLDSAPAPQPQHTASTDAIDAGVNWALVDASADPAPLAVAAYER